MKTIRIWNECGDYSLIKILAEKYKFKYVIVDNPFEEETDICFLNMGNFMLGYIEFKSRFYKLKGTPKLIIGTAESSSNGYHMTPNKINTLSFYQQDNYTLSHALNTNQNSFVPYIAVMDWDNAEENRKNNIKHKKDKFCNIITSDTSIQREFYINYITNNYKKVDSYGKAYHNTPKEYYSDEELNDIIPSYKFSLVIENELSFDNEIYLTEKIVRAFNWGTIPIYWGAKNANKIINENAFINITDLSPKEALDLIRKYDEDDDLYNEMLNQTKAFVMSRNTIFENRDTFVKHIIFNDKETQLIHKTYNIGIDGCNISIIKTLLDNDHYKFNYTQEFHKFNECDIVICNDLNIANKLVKDYKLKVLFICYKYDYDVQDIKNNLFTISEQDYNMHNLYIPHEIFIIKDIKDFNLYCHNIECVEPLKYYQDFNYFEYYRKTLIYFIVDIIKENMKRPIIHLEDYENC